MLWPRESEAFRFSCRLFRHRRRHWIGGRSVIRRWIVRCSRREQSNTLTGQVACRSGNARGCSRTETSTQGGIHRWIVDKLPFVVVILLLKFLERFLLGWHRN